MENYCVYILRVERSSVITSRTFPYGAICIAENIETDADIVRFPPVSFVPEKNFLKL